MELIDRIRIIPRRRIEDSRGWFLKVIDGLEPGIPTQTGEVYLTTARPGEQRGNHYHPATDEWFTVVQGQARLLLADPQTGARAELALSAVSPATIHVPAGIAHVFINAADADEPLLLVAYAANGYDPADTIAFAVA